MRLGLEVVGGVINPAVVDKHIVSVCGVGVEGAGGDLFEEEGAFGGGGGASLRVGGHYLK